MSTQHRIATLLIALSAGLTVTAVPTAANAAPPASAAPAAIPVASTLPWPARLSVASGLKPETEALQGAGWKPMGTIEPIDVPLSSIHLTSWESPSFKKGQEEDWALLTARARTPLKGATPQFEKTGGFVFVPSFSDDPAPTQSSRALMFRFISARSTAPAKVGELPTVAVERTWFALYDPLPPKPPPGEPAPADAVAPPPRGLIVFLPGMFGTPADQIVALIRRFRQEGYCVLRMMSQPSRFTQSITYPLPLEGDISAAVPPIAADLTDRAAESAYAVESAVLYAKQERPALKTLPRVAVGMSGGAMLLPIVLAREPSAYSAAVSIAGGVDYLRILTTSNYADWIDAVRVQWTGKRGDGGKAGGAAAASGNDPPARPMPSAKRLDELSALYRAAAPLDSTNLMSIVKTIPWLILHGTTDKAVPAATGQELWELLGKPERIEIKGGHEWVFMTLSGKFNAITDWINKRVPVPAISPPSPSGAPR